MKKSLLKIEDLSKKFGNTEVLKHISFEVYEGEFITLLGPSGCGKTTTLRLIAGLEDTNTGKILLDEIDITPLPAEKRKVNTVFQNYALFPHMDVFNNIAYGLKIKNIPKPDIKERVNKILSQVQMDGFAKRMPAQLSGGQRQRIAIARALINEPQILLLDEPLGALDLKLRHHMQAELKSMQKSFNITFIYVTHDQDEALNMSDRLIVMDKGKIMQTGTPNEIYNIPKKQFVAEFVGDRNILFAKYIESDGDCLYFDYNGLVIEASNPNNIEVNDNTCLTIHSDKVHMTTEEPEGFKMEALVIGKQYTGSQTKLDIRLSNENILKKIDYNNSGDFHKCDKLYINWDYRDCIVVESGEEN